MNIVYIEKEINVPKAAPNAPNSIANGMEIAILINIDTAYAISLVVCLFSAFINSELMAIEFEKSFGNVSNKAKMYTSIYPLPIHNFIKGRPKITKPERIKEVIKKIIRPYRDCNSEILFSLSGLFSDDILLISGIETLRIAEEKDSIIPEIIAPTAYTDITSVPTVQPKTRLSTLLLSWSNSEKPKI